MKKKTIAKIPKENDIDKCFYVTHSEFICSSDEKNC